MEVLRLSSLLLVLLLWFSATDQVNSAVNGGAGCAVCVALTGIMDQLAILHDSSIQEEFDRLCDLIPEGIFNTACKNAMGEFAPVITELYEELGSIDLACHSLGICFVEPEEGFCHLYPLPESRRFYHHSNSRRLAEFRQKFGSRIEICDLPGFKEICEAIERLSNNLPFSDVDGDKFSTVAPLRGSDWRGKDCNDNSATIYPGRIPENGDAESDSNCNGIYGVDEETGLPYEEELCGGQSNLGIMILGDSAGAHFHIPKEWLTPSLINREAFSYLPYILANEFDFPMTSSATGYKNITAPIIDGTTDSLYLRMLDRNRCIHRDFQNIARNGGKSSNLMRFTPTLARNQEEDNPLFVMLSIIGNDVCNGRKDTLSGMTTPEQMKERLLETLAYLDDTIPAGSHVILTGLVDGRVLYDNLFDRIHPLGEVRQDATYEDLYEYLNCLQLSPCTGWMNANETLRDLTSQRAAELDVAISEVANDGQYNNFDMIYFDFPAVEVMEEWEAEHGPNTAWQLIEIVDGFHPSQLGQKAFAAKIWEILERDFPNVLGEINPNNQRIIQLFGDQGGYE